MEIGRRKTTLPIGVDEEYRRNLRKECWTRLAWLVCGVLMLKLLAGYMEHQRSLAGAPDVTTDFCVKEY